MRLKRSATTSSLPPRPDPPRPTIHQHPPNQAMTIIALFACAVIAIILGWHFLVYVFAKFGARYPERALATTIIVLVGFTVLALFVKYILVSIIKMFLDNRIELEELRYLRAQQQQLASTIGAPAGRALDEEEKFSKLILAVMGEAYNHLATVGQYEHSDAKPWSWRQAINHTIDGKKVTDPQARRVRPFLTEYGIIQSDVIQVGKYGRLDDVRVLLDRLYNIPIAYNNTPLPRDNSGYEFTDENARMG